MPIKYCETQGLIFCDLWEPHIFMLWFNALSCEITPVRQERMQHMLCQALPGLLNWTSDQTPRQWCLSQNLIQGNLECYRPLYVNEMATHVFQNPLLTGVLLVLLQQSKENKTFRLITHPTCNESSIFLILICYLVYIEIK